MNASDKLAHFKTVCRKSGLKVTLQRTEVYRALLETPDHPPVEAVADRVRRAHPEISLDTVYRTLHTLKDIGLALTFYDADGKSRYDGSTHRHGHFVCRRCGNVIDIDKCCGSIPVKDLASYGVSQIDDIVTTFYGLCEGCDNADSTA
jgi:Fur family transcriptional regulator, peroxide stress response regulator